MFKSTLLALFTLILLYTFTVHGSHSTVVIDDVDADSKLSLAIQILGFSSDVGIEKAPDTNMYVLSGNKESVLTLISFLNERGVTVLKTHPVNQLTTEALVFEDEIEEVRINIDRLLLKGVEDLLKSPFEAEALYAAITKSIGEYIDSLRKTDEVAGLQDFEVEKLNSLVERLNTYVQDNLYVMSLLTPKAANKQYIEIRARLEERLKSHGLVDSGMDFTTPSLRVGYGYLTYEIAEARKKINTRVRAEFYLELLEKSLSYITIWPGKENTVYYKSFLAKIWASAFRGFMQTDGHSDKALALRLNAALEDSALLQMGPLRTSDYSQAGAEVFFMDMYESGVLRTLSGEILKVTLGKSDMWTLTEGLSNVLTYKKSPFGHYTYDSLDADGKKKSVVINENYTLVRANKSNMCLRLLN